MLFSVLFYNRHNIGISFGYRYTTLFFWYFFLYNKKSFSFLSWQGVLRNNVHENYILPNILCLQIVSIKAKLFFKIQIIFVRYNSLYFVNQYFNHISFV